MVNATLIKAVLVLCDNSTVKIQQNRSQLRQRWLKKPIGKPVILPDGSRIVDPNGSSSSGYIMSPVADLSPIAAAGQRAGKLYRGMMADPRNKANAINVLLLNLFTNVGTGGAFDYQREGNQIVGHLTQFKQLRQFRDVSNINVGLYCQQAGLTLEETLREAGGYARQFSSNARADQPYGLHRFQKQFITMGFEIGQSGIYDKDRRQ